MLAESQLDDRLLKGVDAHIEHKTNDDGEDGGPHLAIDVSTIREGGEDDDWQERDDATHRHLGTWGASHVEDGLLIEEIIIELHTGDAVVFSTLGKSTRSAYFFILSVTLCSKSLKNSFSGSLRFISFYFLVIFCWQVILAEDFHLTICLKSKKAKES